MHTYTHTHKLSALYAVVFFITVYKETNLATVIKMAITRIVIITWIVMDIIFPQ